MKNIRILDCTLRDGGRIIDCKFPDDEIRDITARLADAKIDIIEIGFLRDWHNNDYRGNTTFFTKVEQIEPFIAGKRLGTIYTAFVDYGMFDIDSLGECTGKSIDAIRLGFTKKDYETSRNDVIHYCEVIKEQGYKLFIQGVNSLNYSDRELLEIVDMVNEIAPYSFGIVDTYGAMYIDDVDRTYGLIDHNLSKDICIDFHSHNNYQLSFGFAQEVIKLSKGARQIIIDGTLLGMGKAAGNLCTELVAEYMVRKLHYDYEIEDIIDIIDDYIYRYSLNNHWGYSIPAMMAGIYKSHPNNIIYLTEKFRLDTKDVGNILAMIDPVKRQRYDYGNIEKLYIEYSSVKVDDKNSVGEIRSAVGDREIVVLAPGDSLNGYRNRIDGYIDAHDCFVVSVNFVADKEEAYAFYGNQKRYKQNEMKRRGRKIIRCSNIKSGTDDIVVNYQRLIAKGHKYFDNSTIMLLNLLKRLEPRQITIAGFDGFTAGKSNNYMNEEFQNDRHSRDFDGANEDIGNMFREIREALDGKCKITFLTPSQYADDAEVILP